MFELNNNQRKYFGLELVLKSWDRVILKGDSYRPDSILYYEKNTIKKQIISSNSIYKEIQLNEITENRSLILPKTKRGKPKKLTASVLESKTPIGVYLNIVNGNLTIGNYTTQTTFYSRDWEYKDATTNIVTTIVEFINNSESDHFSKINTFKQQKRKNIKYKSGDFFAFKLNRTEYGFGRVLFDVHKAIKKHLVPQDHGFCMIMGNPVLIKFYAFTAKNKDVDIELLKKQKSLPSDYIMDNVIFYGEYEIIGYLPLNISEFDFPISYGNTLDTTPNVFLQWGLIHSELPNKKFNKYTSAINNEIPENNPSRYIQNPYGYYRVGFRSTHSNLDIIETVNNNGYFDFSKGNHYRLNWDLRNPKNDKIRVEIMKKFGFNPSKSYIENSRNKNTKEIIEIIKQMQ